ncbi:MAG: TolC family protein [Crocinitomicaceae bacterium]|nr:TolC family protein [Crocinitomicaceae bacterium]
MNQIINKKLATLFFLLLTTTFGSAQSLSELIQLALTNNYQIRILKNEEAMASNLNTVGNSGQLPTVILDGGITTASNTTRQEFADGSLKEGSNARSTNANLSLLANWTVFDGFAVYARKDQLEYLEQLGQLNSKFYIEQTVADLVVAYYQLVFEKQLLANHKLAMTISSYRVRLEEKKRSVGSGKMVEYGQANVDYNTDSIAYMAQLNRIQSLEIELNRILSNPLETPLTIDAGEYTFTPLLQKDTLLNQTENNNAQLEQFMLQELISEADLRMEKANRYPTINLFAGYQVSQSTAEVGFIELNRNIGPVVGLNVSFNLYNGGINNTAIKNTLLENENAELNTAQVRQNLQAQVYDLYLQHKSLADRIAMAKINVDTMQKVYEIAAQQFSQGDINGYEFRLTQLSLLNAQLSLNSLLFTLKITEINLNRISGTVLSAYL